MIMVLNQILLLTYLLTSPDWLWWKSFRRTSMMLRSVDALLRHDVVHAVICLSVRLSVTHLYSIKTAKRSITQTVPYDSPGTLVFDAKELDQMSFGLPLTEAPNTGGVG